MSESLSLSQLTGGQSGIVRLVNSSAMLEKQCRALGLCPGVEIQVLRTAKGKGPMQVKSQGSFYAIRGEEASHIQVQLNVDRAGTEAGVVAGAHER